jgi:hypothetical protein
VDERAWAQLCLDQRSAAGGRARSIRLRTASRLAAIAAGSGSLDDARIESFWDTGFSCRQSSARRMGTQQGMLPLNRIQSLMARITALEQHAAAVQRAFRSEDLKTEAEIVIATLRVAADDLRGAPSEDVVDGVDARLGVISKRLSGLGRST